MPSTPGGEEEEEAVAGRLEIRVVDATGGATVVQTTADREPLQSRYQLFRVLVYSSAHLFTCIHVVTIASPSDKRGFFAIMDFILY